jgi:predicted nucleotidyltransferase component of viral defense system
MEPTRRSPASIRARLLDRSKREGTEFQRTLVLYGNERFLYRLSRSEHAQNFVLKGASLFTLWAGRVPRATKDVDLLGFGSPDPAGLLRLFHDVLSTSVEADGVEFELGSLRAEPIREDAVYDGVRITFRAHLGSAVIPIQVDVGFGDVTDPAPEMARFPSLLDLETAMLRVYRPEVAIAEKYHAMVELGLTNSRMKDYFDIAFLAGSREFEGETLGRAIRGTFARRQTPLPSTLPQGLQEAFAADAQKRSQWQAFVRRVDPDKQMPLVDAVRVARDLLWPVTTQVTQEGRGRGLWTKSAWARGIERDLGRGR